MSHQPTIAGTVGTFEIGDYTLSYEVRGRSKGRPIVLIHGLLLPSWINGEVADRLVARGHQVVMFDLLGHGRSDKPRHASQYRLEYAGRQVVALLDHLGAERAVVGGMSLGANVALEVGARFPDRVQGLVCEMPVLERGLVGATAVLLPLMTLLRVGGAVVGPLFRLVGRLPRTRHQVINAILDTGGDPRVMTAVMHGYATGPICPPASDRKAIVPPTLVIAHRRDILHPMDDAEALVEEVRDGRLVQARSMAELRTRPDRLVEQIAVFLDEVWDQPANAGSEHA